MLDYRFDLGPNSRSQLVAMDSGAQQFPLAARECGEFYAGKDYYTKRDGVNCAILLYTKSGCGYILKNGQSSLLRRGQAIIINCENYHEYRTQGDETWHFRWVHITGAGLESYADALINRTAPVDVDITDDMDRCFDSIEKLTDGGIYPLAVMNAAIGEMLLILLRSQAGTDSVRQDVSQLAGYIRENCARELHIDDFMERMNLSKYYLIRLFRQHMGVTPYKYMHQCRVRRAEELLRTTELSVESIAEAVGYSDTVNFIRHFSQSIGTTPNRYRRESMGLIVS